MRALGVLMAVGVLVAPAAVCCWLGGWLLLVGVPSLLLWLGLGCWAAAGLYDMDDDAGGGYCDAGYYGAGNRDEYV